MKTHSFLLFLLCLFLTTSCSEDKIAPGFAFQTTRDLTLASDEGSQTTLTFTSATDWRATGGDDWITVSPSSGRGGTFDLTITARSENQTGSVRTATLTLSSGSLTENVTIRQEIGNFVLPEQDTYTVPVEGKDLEVVFSTNVSEDQLKVYSSNGSNWITQAQDRKIRAYPSYAVRLTVLPNTGNYSRTAYLYFVKETADDAVVLDTVTIIQQGLLSEGESTDYSADKTVRVMQTATLGKGIPIVLIGDGFIDTEIVGGTYDKVMEKTMEHLFTEEPMSSLRNYFNVYAVTAVSRNNSFGDGYTTALKCKMEGGNSTGISGDDYAVQDYIRCVENIDYSAVLAVVILNSPNYAGTTYFGYADANQNVLEFAVAYCTVIHNLESESFRQVVVHEAVGHGYAKLDDEYFYEGNGTIPASEITRTQYMQTLGWAQNVDFTNNTSRVLWSKFLNDSRYASQDLGVFEGASTYPKGAYRPSDQSMMRQNINGFNAPSRKAIYDRTMREVTGTASSYEEFVAFDQQTGLKKRSVRSEEPGKPFTHPRFVNKTLKLN